MSFRYFKTIDVMGGKACLLADSREELADLEKMARGMAKGHYKHQVMLFSRGAALSARRLRLVIK